MIYINKINQDNSDIIFSEYEKILRKRAISIYNYDLSNLLVENKCLNKISFINCNLSGSKFINCSFKNSNFCNCNLSDMNLETSNIKKCNFHKNILDNIIMPDYPMACPENGSFIGYKKVIDINDFTKHYILKLQIPADAKRSSATDKLCRCNKAEVLNIQNLDGSPVDNILKVGSICNYKFIYKIGEMVEEPNFNECRWEECTSGIHFFVNRKDAVNY